MKHATLDSTPFRRPRLLGAASLLIALGCESSTEPRDGSGPLDGLPATGEIQLQLTRADDCADLLTRIQNGLLAPLAERAEQLRDPAGANGYDGRWVTGGGVAVPGIATPEDAAQRPAPVPAPGGTPAPPASGPANAGANNGGEAESLGDPGANDVAPTAPAGQGGFSGTTVQVKDVDEADIVKTDGDLIYLLHGGTLFVLRGWPANSTEILASTLVEGQPVEMFVRAGRAVVFSRVYGDVAAAASPAAARPAGYSSGYTKLTVFDVTGDTPAVLRESYVEGEYVSARRHDGLVRAVIQDGFKVPQLGSPYIEYVDAFGEPFSQAEIDAQVDAWLERTVRSVRNTDLGDWLPREFAREDGRLVPQDVRCGDYYAPDPGLTESGVTSVVALDLDDATAPLGGATILGRAERVYANDAALLVTQTDYRYQFDAAAAEQTIIHRFDLDGAATSYTASGAVRGSIHDQFSLDEREGVIRVSTTEERFGFAPPGAAVEPAIAPAPGGPTPVPNVAPAPRPANGPVNRVVTLGTEGQALVELGSTADFGLNERVFSTRFIGDRGYVVTFRRIDPLVVVDLSDPKNPQVVGELKIPGFSDYLFPLGDDHLFAIGQDATAEGFVQGLALQIFDVSDASNPTLAQRYVFPEPGASPANIDHRAISFHPSGNVVAFPYQSYQTGENTLEVFQLSPEAGFRRLGGMVEPIDLERCLVAYGYDPADIDEVSAQLENDPAWQAEIVASCRWNRQFRRGLFREDIVYGISSSGLYAYDLTAMDAGAVGQLSLPAEVYDYGRYGDSGVDIARPVPPMVSEPPPPTPPTEAAGTGSAGEAMMAGKTDSAEESEADDPAP